MTFNYRPYDPKKDKKATHRIWSETGWLKKGDEKLLDDYFASGRTLVSEMDKEAECLVVSYLGEFLYQKVVCKFSCIAAVTTSFLARKQRFAGKLTAIKIAQDAKEGAIISGLGMFEQGFYNRLGFGTGNYENIISFVPATLNINKTPPVPIRLTDKHIKKIHTCRKKRLRYHGSVTMPEAMTRLEFLRKKETGFGFGYLNDKKEISHFILLTGKGKENGPFWVECCGYETKEQLIELLALLKSLGDQILCLKMIEPPEIQLQDFLNKPFFHRELSNKSEFASSSVTEAFWQLRILDLNKCLKKSKFLGKQLQFNLDLTDPIENFLKEVDIDWKGISGKYHVQLGENSWAKKGFKKSLPTMKASVNAFSRLWLGILPASTLSVCEDMSAPVTLLNKLDDLIKLPPPKVDWLF